MIEQLAAGAALLVLLAAAWSDFRTVRIGNIWPLLLILLFAAYALTGGRIDQPWMHLAHFGVALAAGMLLFAMKWIGGGDAKLYAAIALWFPLSQGAWLLLATTLAGLVLAVVYLLTRRLVPREQRKDRRIPYGVAIAAGAVTAWFLAPGAVNRTIDVNELATGDFHFN